MKMTTVVCSRCGMDAEKPKKEVTRSIKLGRPFFCGLSCAGFRLGNAYKHKLNAASSLKSREGWKYVELESALKHVVHEFEFSLGRFVFDLCLQDKLILVEFDGKNHKHHRDLAKDAYANSEGYTVFHLNIDDTHIISAALFRKHFNYKGETQMASRTAEGKHTKRFIIEVGWENGIWKRSCNEGLKGFFGTREEAQAALASGVKSEFLLYRVRQK